MTEINVTLPKSTLSPDEYAAGYHHGMIAGDQLHELINIQNSISSLYQDGKLTSTEIPELSALITKLDTLKNKLSTADNLTKMQMEELSKELSGDIAAFTSAFVAETNAASTDPLASMDIATALMFVQSERVARLEDQIKDQLASVKLRNDQVAKLNKVQTALNGLVNKFSANDSTVAMGDKATAAQLKEVTDLANASGFKIDPPLSSNTTRGDLTSFAEKVKNEIDGLTNTQQMDMLRLQSLNNKRNEAFEVMTNVMKKVSDLLSNITSKI